MRFERIGEEASMQRCAYAMAAFGSAGSLLSAPVSNRDLARAYCIDLLA
jgi:hypothetical protein